MRSLAEAKSLLSAARGDGLDPGVLPWLEAVLDETTAAGSSLPETGAGPGAISLVTFILDESAAAADVSDMLQQCYASAVRTLGIAEGGNGVYVSTWAYGTSRQLIGGFFPAEQAPLTLQRFLPSGKGALHDTVLSAFASQVIAAQDAWRRGRPSINHVVLLSAGGDGASVTDPDGRGTLAVADALVEQADYYLAFIGFGSSRPLDEAEGWKRAIELGFNNVLLGEDFLDTA